MVSSVDIFMPNTLTLKQTSIHRHTRLILRREYA